VNARVAPQQLFQPLESSADALLHGRGSENKLSSEAKLVLPGAPGQKVAFALPFALTAAEIALFSAAVVVPAYLQWQQSENPQVLAEAASAVYDKIAPVVPNLSKQTVEHQLGKLFTSARSAGELVTKFRLMVTDLFRGAHSSGWPQTPTAPQKPTTRELPSASETPKSTPKLPKPAPDPFKKPDDKPPHPSNAPRLPVPPDAERTPPGGGTSRCLNLPRKSSKSLNVAKKRLAERILCRSARRSKCAA
jgi:hypothetical protein